MPVCATAAAAPAPFGLPSLFKALFPQPLAMTVDESKESYEITTDLPEGTMANDITINVSRGLVTIATTARNGTGAAPFVRSFKLPANADSDCMEASFKDKTLIVTFPKKLIGVAAVVAERVRAARAPDAVSIPVASAAAPAAAPAPAAAAARAAAARKAVPVTTADAKAAKQQASASARAAAAELARAVKAGEVTIKATADEVTFKFN